MIDQTTAIGITALIACVFGAFTMPLGFLMFIKELNKKTVVEIRRGGP